MDSSKADPHIEAFRKAAEANWKRSAKPSVWKESIKDKDFASIKPMLFQLGKYWPGCWGEKAGDSDLMQAARSLIEAQTLGDQLAHLYIFRRRAFPMEPTVLLELAASTDENVALAASVALTNIEHPSVRNFAFQLIQFQTIGLDYAVAMLAQNYESGDHEIILGWFRQEADREVRHRLGMDLNTFWERHPDPDGEVRMLLGVYEKGPCSFCREFAVRRLMDLNALPDSLRSECEYDCNDAIRVLVMDGGDSTE